MNSIGVFVFAAISPFGIALGQTASGSPIVGDVAVASGPAARLDDADLTSAARQIRELDVNAINIPSRRVTCVKKVLAA
jgi:hypothetical protein